jgi:predicted peroxiredoxin
MVNTDPRNGPELGAPFFQATVAAAMEYEVEIIFTGSSGQLVKKGFAEKLYVQDGSDKSVYDIMKDAHEAGAKFKVCTPTIELWGDDLIPEVSETVGGAYVISEAMDENTVTFTY